MEAGHPVRKGEKATKIVFWKILDIETKDDAGEKHKDKIKYILCSDSGITNALNQALQVITGDIICEMNDDDMLYDENVLDKVSNHLIAGEEWLYSKMVYIDKEGKEGGGGGRKTTLN